MKIKTQTPILHLAEVDLIAKTSRKSAWTIFSEAMRARGVGYDGFYPDSFIPFDATDFINRHFLLSMVTEGELKPLCNFRYIFWDRCAKFNIAFPILKNAIEAQSDAHVKYIQELTRKHELGVLTLVYPSMFTIMKLNAESRDLRTLCWEVFGASHHYVLSQLHNPYCITGATEKLKTDRWLETFGYESAAIDDAPLHPLFKVNTQCTIKVMALSGVSTSIGDYFEKFKYLFNTLSKEKINHEQLEYSISP